MQNDKPLVSFIITSYNYEKYIEAAVNSVLNQSVQDFEIIIVDDASSDNSFDIIQKIASSNDKIKIFQNKKNIGLCKSLQFAVNQASGTWLAFLETDDTITSDYLQEKLSVIQKYPDVNFIYNKVEFTGENNKSAEQKFKNIVYNNEKNIYPKNMFYNFGFENPVLTMSSVMLKKSILNDINFNTPIDKLIDWYIYIQIAKKTQFYYINKPLTLWTQHNNSYVKQNNKIKFKFANISAYMNIYKKEPYNIKLLVFIIISTIKMCIKRLKFYISK